MNHEKLDCYKMLLKSAEDIAKIVTKWRRGYANLSDQLMRAMTSAVLNLSEGNAKRSSSKDRRRFFEISLGSIAEVASCLDLAKAFGLISEIQKEYLKSSLKLAYIKIQALP